MYCLISSYVILIILSYVMLYPASVRSVSLTRKRTRVPPVPFSRSPASERDEFDTTKVCNFRALALDFLIGLLSRTTPLLA